MVNIFFFLTMTSNSALLRIQCKLPFYTYSLQSRKVPRLAFGLQRLLDSSMRAISLSAGGSSWGPLSRSIQIYLPRSSGTLGGSDIVSVWTNPKSPPLSRASHHTLPCVYSPYSQEHPCCGCLCIFFHSPQSKFCLRFLPLRKQIFSLLISL